MKNPRLLAVLTNNPVVELNGINSLELDEAYVQYNTQDLVSESDMLKMLGFEQQKEDRTEEILNILNRIKHLSEYESMYNQ